MELTERAHLLADFVSTWNDQPVVWGQSDCTAFAAEWVKTVTGKRVPFLADYASRDEAHRLIEYFGGLSRIWEQALSKAGIYEQIGKPLLGDVGIVQLADHREIGLIVVNDGVSILRTEKGTRFLRPRSFVKVWSTSS